MYPLKQSTAITVPFFVHDVNGDAVTGLSDGSFTKTVSKNGGSLGSMTVTITELATGWYSIPVSTSHSDTLGILTIVMTNAGAKQVNLQFRVSARIPDDMAFPTTTGRSLDIAADGAIEVVDLLTGHTAQGGDSFARLGAPVGASISADVAVVDGNVDTLITRITSTIFSGITSLGEWLGLLAGKQVGDTTARNEIRATGAGSGTFNEATDSNEQFQEDIAAISAIAAAVLVDTNELGAAVGASISADIAAVKVDTAATLVDTADMQPRFTGITSLAEWLGLLAGKQVGDATALTEIKGTGAGSGTYNEATDSHEAIRDTAPLGTAMRGTDRAALASVLGAAVGADISADVAAVKVDTAATLVDTAVIGAAGAGLTAVPWNAAWDAEVESEVNDALDTAISELSQGKPSATPTIRTALMLLYMALRNRVDVNTSGSPDVLNIYNDAGTVIAKKQLTDDGSDYSEAEIETGP